MLHVVLNLEAGGLERVVYDIVRSANPEMWEHRVACLEFSGRLGDALRDVAQVDVCGAQSKMEMFHPTHLIRVMQQFNPHVVHSHSGVWHKAALAARKVGIPYVVHTDHGRHGSDPWHLRLLERMAAARTDVVVAVSDVLARYLLNRVVPKRTRMCVIPNGIDVSRFGNDVDVAELRTELGVLPDEPIIGSLGRLDHIKGYDIAIHALHDLLTGWCMGPEPVLVLIGEGPELDALRGLAEQLQIGHRVRFTGWRTDPEQLYQVFDVFTLSSRSEGTSVSLLEAMSSGTCPVVTDVGGNRAVLGKELAHRLVTPLSPSALADEWRNALTNRDTAARDGNLAQARVRRHYSLDAMLASYEHLYRGELPGRQQIVEATA